MYLHIYIILHVQFFETINEYQTNSKAVNIWRRIMKTTSSVNVLLFLRLSARDWIQNTEGIILLEEHASEKVANLPLLYSTP